MKRQLHFLSALIALLAGFSLHASAAQHDLIIRGGKFDDRTGKPEFYGDVAVKGDRIAAVGAVKGDATHLIDATGLVVAPGFIDMHSHSDWVLLEDGNAQSKIRQGVTTEIIGESTSVAPATGKLRPRTVSGKDQSLEIRRLRDYFSAVERAGISVKEAIEIGQRAALPVDILHLKIADEKYWGRMKEVVSLIDEARRNGVNVQANIYPYTRGNNDLVSIIPPWAHEGGRAQLLARLKDPAQRPRLKQDIRNGVPGWYNHYTAVGGDWRRMLISANNQYQGLTMDRVIEMKSEGK